MLTRDAVELSLGGELRLALLDWGEFPVLYSTGSQAYTIRPRTRATSFTVAADARFARFFHAAAGATRISWDQRNRDDLPAGIQDFTKAEGSSWDFGFLLTYSKPNPDGWSFSPGLAWSLRDVSRALKYSNGLEEEYDSYDVGAVSLLAEGPYAKLLGTTVPAFSAVLNLDFSTVSSVGLELATYRVGFLRLGFQNEGGHDAKPVTIGIGARLLIQQFRVQIDYALVPFEIINGGGGPINHDNKGAIMVAWIPAE